MIQLPTKTLSDRKKDDPRYKLAEILLQPQTNRITHPLEGVANMARAAAGAYKMNKLDKEYEQKENVANQTLTGAMDAYGKTQQGGQTNLNNGETVTWNKSSPDEAKQMLISALSKNSETAPISLQMQLSDMSAKEQMAAELAKYQTERADKAADWEKEAALKRELAGNGTTNPQGSYDPTPLAQAMGVPAKPLDTRGLVGKDAQIYTRNARTNAEKRLQSDDMTQAAQKARGNIADSKRFSELMANQKTGPIVGSKLNPLSYLDPQIGEMRKIQDRLTPQQRTPGSGATSDFDARMFQNALMGANALPETNKAVITAMQAKAQDELNFQSFLSDYLEANGHLNGADSSWQKYVSDNPIFDPASPNVPTINAQRKTYQEYFGQPPQMGPQTPQETPPSGGLREELERLRAQKAGR